MQRLQKLQSKIRQSLGTCGVSSVVLQVSQDGRCELLLPFETLLRKKSLRLGSLPKDIRLSSYRRLQPTESWKYPLPILRKTLAGLSRGKVPPAWAAGLAKQSFLELRCSKGLDSSAHGQHRCGTG